MDELSVVPHLSGFCPCGSLADLDFYSRVAGRSPDRTVVRGPGYKWESLQRICAFATGTYFEAQGATLNSSDLNPIGQVFAKLKALLRHAAARTVEKLWQTWACYWIRFSLMSARSSSEIQAMFLTK
ncbi:MAG: hypothetical protein ACXW0G_04235 [Methylosarcina sp.]